MIVHLQNTQQEARKTLQAESRRLNGPIQTSGYLYMSRLILFTLNRRLDSDTSDVCFSVNLHYMLSGRDPDVWIKSFRRLIPVAFVFQGFGPGFCSERFLRPFPTLVTYVYVIVDHSSLVLMNFYSSLCYDPLLRIVCR